MTWPRSYREKPIAAVGVVVLKENRVLLVQRAHPPHQGAWTLPGGAIELGETARQAARREIQEECGLRILVQRVLDVVDIVQRDARGQVRYHYTVVEFLAQYLEGTLKAASDAKQARWVPLGELGAFGLSKAVLDLVHQALVA